jgi:UDP-glucose 4-epimerase
MAIRSLVTGGAGFLGSYVVDELIRLGHEVVAVDDLSGGFRENVHPQALFEQGSVVDGDFINRLFARFAFDYVFHLAAYAAEGLSHFIRRFNYTNNVLGSVTLINAAVNWNVKRFVFTSSIAVYGSGQVPLREDTSPKPEDPYGIAKYAVELDLASAHHLFGLKYTIFRPHNVYGERQNIADRYRNVIGIFMNQILRGEPCTVFGDGHQTRAFTHVLDVAPLIARTVEIPQTAGQVFNVGADAVYSVNQLVEAVQKAVGKNTGVVHLEPRKEAIHAFADHTKVRQLLDYEPAISLSAGLTRMAEWVMRAGPSVPGRFQAIEIQKNLPRSWQQS